MDIKNITLNPKNPRYISSDKMRKLKKLIKEFPNMMELRPIICDKKGMILGGNMRYMALLEMEYTEIPDTWVRKASELTPEEIQRFIIVDNIPFGEYDYTILFEDWEKEELRDYGMEVIEYQKEMNELPESAIGQEIGEAYGAISFVYNLPDYEYIVNYIQVEKGRKERLGKFIIDLCRKELEE